MRVDKKIVYRTTDLHISIVDSCGETILAANKEIQSRLEKMKVSEIKEYIETLKIITGDVSDKKISKRLRFMILKRDDFTCNYCGRKAPNVILHIDHKKPISKGGKTEETNLVTSCADCNLGKSNLYTE